MANYLSGHGPGADHPPVQVATRSRTKLCEAVFSLAGSSLIIIILGLDSSIAMNDLAGMTSGQDRQEGFLVWLPRLN